MLLSARLTVAAERSAATSASEWARALGAQLSLTEQQIYRLDLCVTELVTNVASYAYGDRDGVIELNAHAAHEGADLRVEIIDSGSPFDPLDARAAAPQRFSPRRTRDRARARLRGRMQLRAARRAECLRVHHQTLSGFRELERDLYGCVVHEPPVNALCSFRARVADNEARVVPAHSHKRRRTNDAGIAPTEGFAQARAHQFRTVTVGAGFSRACCVIGARSRKAVCAWRSRPRDGHRYPNRSSISEPSCSTLTGLTRCASKPAAREAARSSSRP